MIQFSVNQGEKWVKPLWTSFSSLVLLWQKWQNKPAKHLDLPHQKLTSGNFFQKTMKISCTLDLNIRQFSFPLFNTYWDRGQNNGWVSASLMPVISLVKLEWTTILCTNKWSIVLSMNLEAVCVQDQLTRGRYEQTSLKHYRSVHSGIYLFLTIPEGNFLMSVGMGFTFTRLIKEILIPWNFAHLISLEFSNIS